MYKPVKDAGDTVQVPQLLFSKLTAPGANEARFRVALYLLSQNGAGAEQIVSALRMSRKEVENALIYWEGAGLIESEAPAPVSPPPAAKKYMNPREVAKAGETNQTLDMLLEELQRIMGGVLTPTDISVFVTMFVQDKLPPDLVLTAAAYCAGLGKFNARYVEKVLLSWQREGVQDAVAADAYLKQLALREKREKKLAAMLGLAGNPFTLAEKRRIAEWFEEYGYGKEMIETARLAAGEKQNEVKYLGAILKKWYAKGYKTPKDVQMAGENRNLRVHSSKHNTEKQDRLVDITEYVPMKPRRKGP